MSVTTDDLAGLLAHWDVSEIAQHLGLGPDYVRRTLVERIGFPRPTLRWPAGAVMEWKHSQPAQSRKPHPREVEAALVRANTPMSDFLRAAVRQARKRATKNGRLIDIEFTSVAAMMERQESRCAVSRIPFSLEPVPGSAVRPFAPSIDRIDSANDYLNGNVRLVCHCINLLMNEWGDRVFFALLEKLKSVQCSPPPK